MEEKHENLEEIFKNPPNEFRMMPFWFWNHEMVEKEVTRQIQDHHDHGIGGEFIHPRHGRLTPYMGQRWMENVEAAADKCKELNMPCFLYDEDNFPSGPVSGKITGPYNPENRGKRLFLFDEDEFEGPQSIEKELHYQNISEKTKFFAAIAVPSPENYPDFSESISQAINVTAFVEDGILKWDVPEGEWTIAFFCIAYFSYEGEMNGYIDILRKETVKQFIEETHQKYVDWFIQQGKAEYLGTVIPGIFTDEPSMTHDSFPQAFGMKEFIFTLEMPARFKTMFGYEFTEILLSMVYETGAISSKHRCNYWECTIDLYVNAYYVQIKEFCTKYNWRHTGHINSEGIFPDHIRNHGDFFKVFEHMDYGGCDQLQEIVRPDGIEELWNIEEKPYFGMAQDMILASKFASSAAHLLGKPRVLVEAFGTSGWGITLGSAKRINDYLIATGCDLFVPHDFAYSEDGYRKLDHPASFNHQPYYKHWKLLADYNARLCATLNAHAGVLNAEVLFLYPSTSFHAEMMPRTSDTAEILSSVFTHNADCMFRQQIDFELANEDMIMGGEIVGQKKKHIKIRNQTFDVLVLGGSTCISLNLAKFILKFFNLGGKVLATTFIPYKDKNEGESKEIAQIMEEVFGVSPFTLRSQLKEKSISEIRLIENTNPQGGHAIFIETPFDIPYRGPYFPAFQKALEKLIPARMKNINVWKDPEKSQHAAYIMAMNKTIEGKQFYFLANTSSSIEYFATKVELNVNPKRVELWDSVTGEIQEFTDFSFENGKMRLHLDFPLYRSYLFVVTPYLESEKSAINPKSFSIKNKLNESQKTINLGNDWVAKLNNPNSAMLNLKWQLSYHIKAKKRWQYEGLRIFTHEFHVSEKEKIGQIRLVIEGLTGDYAWGKTTYMELQGGDCAHFKIPNTISVFVNNLKVPLKFDFDFEYIDPCWIIADITSKLKEGMNVVRFECKTKNHRIFHLITDPWRLIGKFESETIDGIPYLKPPREKVTLGTLTEQGFARYYGGFSYIKEVEIPAEMSQKQIILQLCNTSDCIEVKVNGELSTVLWNDWSTDITHLIKYGEPNTIELVLYETAQNLMQTNIEEFGLIGDILLHFY